MRRVVLLPLLALLAATLVVPAHAAQVQGRVLHLAVDGSDPTGTNPSASSTPQWCSGGTTARPYATWDYALRCLEPGDTLVVHAGTYRERVRFNVGADAGDRIAAGRPDAPILITGAADEPRPLLRGLLRLEGADHWTIHGIDVTADDRPYGDGDALVKMRGGTGWGVESSQIWDGRSYANVRIEYDDHRDVAPSWWRVVGSCIRTTRATHPGAFKDHNMYVAPGVGSVAGLIADNVMFDAPSGNNIKVGSTILGASDVLIKDNILTDATQNVLLNERTSGVRMEQNLMGPISGGKAWYPNIRGFSLKGANNSSVDNLLFGAGATVFTGSDGNTSTHTISERGTLQFDPQLSGRGCGVRPEHREAARRSITESHDRDASNARIALHGDWDGDGDETPGWWDPFTATFSLAMDHGTGPADVRIRFGARDDRPIVGDWDGDGVDEIGVRNGNRFDLALENRESPNVRTFSFGSVGDRIVSGDWDGDGTDTIGVVKLIEGRVTWFLTNDRTPGPNAEIEFAWGSRDDHLLTGDWDGDGTDGPGVVRGNSWYLDNGFDGGKASDISFRFGSASDTVTTGDWDGDGDETVAVVRGLHWFLTDALTGGNATQEYTLGP